MKLISWLVASSLTASTATAGELNYSIDPEIPNAVDNEYKPRSQGSSGGSAGWIVALIVIGAIGYGVSEYLKDQEENP